MSTETTKLDDLTIIKGIGPTRQEWLRKSFAIRTYNDLAALSPDELEARLKAEGRIASRNELEGWLAQAQHLASQAGPVMPPDVVNHWQAYASYVVEFQTHTVEDAAPALPEYRTVVHHMEADIGKTWPGINTTDLCAWILAQVDVSTPEGPLTGAAAMPAVEAEAPLRLAINHLRLLQLPDVAVKILINEAQRPFPGGIKSGDPFALEVAFTLTGQGALEASNSQTLYSAQFHLRNLVTGTSTHLGDSTPTPLAAGKELYAARLANVTLSPGIYRLRVIVSLHGRPPMIDYIEVPMLQVV